MSAPRVLCAAALVTVLGACDNAGPTAHAPPLAPGALSVRAWSGGGAQVHIRFGHSATLLGDARVLVAGGGGAPTTTEIFDLTRARFVAGPTMTEARTHHTATLLTSGSVLLAGGDGSKTAEIFDPQANTFTKTGSMTIARAGHTALRLRSGKVLVVGGADAPDATAEIFDPQTGAFTATAPRHAIGPGAAALLASGKVLFVAGVDDNAPGVSPMVDLYDPDAGTWTAGAQDPATTVAPRNVVALPGGTALVTSSHFCPSTNTSMNCDTDVVVFDEALRIVGAEPVHMPLLAGRSTATLLPDGTVLFTAGTVPTTDAQIYDPVANAFTVDASMVTPHGGGHTATILPGGDVLLVGGTEASADVRVWTGAPRVSPAALGSARRAHSAIGLRDGRVLVVGGALDFNTLVAPAEVYDPSVPSATAVGSLATPRLAPALALLDSGKVLVVGGGVPNGDGGVVQAEVFDPQAGTFRGIGPTAAPRGQAGLAKLPDGTVLVAGGCADPDCKSAEIFDPTTEKFTLLAATMTSPHPSAAATRLEDGSILVVGPSGADFFDPAKKTFSAAPPPGATRDPATLTSLSQARVFLSGGGTGAADVFSNDNASGTWAWGFTQPLPPLRVDPAWGGTMDGRVLGFGGASGQPNTIVLYDPLAASAPGSVVVDGDNSFNQGLQSITRAGRGLVSIGGCARVGGCVGSVGTIVVWDDGAPASAQPQITSAPAQITGGETVTIAGAGFARGAESPIAYVVTEQEGARVFGAVRGFSDTQLTWTAPTTSLIGHATLFVSVAGVLSKGAPTAIDRAKQAITCAVDAECATGFCTDGFCCDQRCDADCQGCSAARKKGGADGVCGAVPPGDDVRGRCFALQGQPCTDVKQCATKFCVQGVCCNAACDGACLSCTLDGLKGQCSAVQQGACDVACDGDHTLKKVGAPDVDCAPFKCAGKTCRGTCGAATECVPPAVCTEQGVCAPGANATPSDVSTWGCSATRGDAWEPWAIAWALLALARRRRR
jgi:hypothetical protein